MDDKTIDATLLEWATALEIDPGELHKTYHDYLLEEQAAHKQLTEDQLQERALRRVRIRAKREHGPQAIATGTADAIILGVSGKIDRMTQQREEAIQLFREHPQQAVKMGVTDAKGNPIDSEKVFKSGKPNPFYGKVMRAHNYITILVGLASIERDGKKEAPVPFSAIMDRNAPDSKAPPIFHRVKFPITTADYVEQDKLWRLGIPRGAKMDVGKPADPMSVVKKFAPDMLVPLEQLEVWASSHTKYALCAVEGDVVRMDLAPADQRNRRLQIDNGHDIKGFGTTVWVHDELPIDFAEETKLVVFGNARAGNPDSGFGASVNAMGLYAHPDYKTSPPEGIAPFPEPQERAMPPGEIADIAAHADDVLGTGEPEPEPWKAPPAQKPSAPATESEMFVMACVSRLAKDPQWSARGAGFDEVLSRCIQAGFNKTDVEYAINELLEKTRIYEAELGQFKTLEEPTKHEVALYAKRGGK